MKNRSKHVPTLADTIATAWEDLANGDQFAGMTPTQFRTRIKASSDTRDALTSLVSQRRAKRDERATADAVSRAAIQSVVNAVKGHPDHGADSPLLAAMGYVTKSARKSGKTNKTNGNGNGHGASSSQ